MSAQALKMATVRSTTDRPPRAEVRIGGRVIRIFDTHAEAERYRDEYNQAKGLR